MTDYLITNNAAILGGTEDASVAGSFNPLYADHALRFDEASAASLETHHNDRRALGMLKLCDH